jgi:hypothetical protein
LNILHINNAKDNLLIFCVDDMTYSIFTINFSFESGEWIKEKLYSVHFNDDENKLINFYVIGNDCLLMFFPDFYSIYRKNINNEMILEMKKRTVIICDVFQYNDTCYLIKSDESVFILEI